MNFSTMQVAIDADVESLTLLDLEEKRPFDHVAAGDKLLFQRPAKIMHLPDSVYIATCGNIEN